MRRSGGGGTVTETFPPPDPKGSIAFFTWAHSMAIQPDGKIVVAGVVHITDTFVCTGVEAALARFDPDGSLDPTFDVDGMLITNYSSSIWCDRAFGVAIQPDGKIVTAGGASLAIRGLGASGWRPKFTVARYSADGTLDTSFGGDGIVKTNFSRGAGTEIASAVAIQSDGKIVAVGRALRHGELAFAAARYLAA